jgi:hypothetical protein
MFIKLVQINCTFFDNITYTCIIYVLSKNNELLLSHLTTNEQSSSTWVYSWRAIFIYLCIFMASNLHLLEYIHGEQSSSTWVYSWRAIFIYLCIFMASNLHLLEYIHGEQSSSTWVYSWREQVIFRWNDDDIGLVLINQHAPWNNGPHREPRL